MKVIILRGVSGSGKSTYIGKNHPRAVVCSADHFFEKEDGYYDFDPSKLAEAHSECLGRFIALLKNGSDHGISEVVVDNTNIHVWEYENYEKLAKAFGHDVEIVEFRVDKIEQLRKCIARNAHRVPSEVVSRMAVEFEECPTDVCEVRTVDV